jgi:glycosyltransferase involved in cell wall biosynthesis
MTVVHVVVPDGVDDPARPSGGNTYDRHLCRGLTSIGWLVHEHAVPGCWPRPNAASLAALSAVVEQIPGDAVVLLDGLVASTAPKVLVPQARRLRLVVLVHMPLGHRPADHGGEAARVRERAVLSVAAAVVATSAWARRRLLELYPLPADRVHIAEPAVEAADLATGTATGGALLCVAAVTSDKGHDVLLDALATTTNLSWHCVCVGSLDRDPAFVERLRHRVLAGGLCDRVYFPGPRTGADLDRSYAAADLMVLPSRAETYGMVVTEALARGLPVVATEVGGLPEALGYGADGIRPGVLVAPEDPAALGAAIRAWLGDADLRGRLRRAAAERRESLSAWSTTASVLAGVLVGASR